MIISLYHMIPWQREVTLKKETFDVEETHPGVYKLWNHLKASGNRDLRIEILEDGTAIDLVRPLDFEYTRNWIFITSHIKECDKGAFAEIVTRMIGDRWLWFGFRRGRA